jgi:hypothetical protein
MKMLGFALSVAFLLVGCNTSSSLQTEPQATAAGEEALTASRRVSCEIHYYDSASLPNPHILSVASGTAATSSLSATPLFLSTPEGVTASIGVFNSGLLSVEADAQAGFLASGAYALPLAGGGTDLQAPMPPIEKDGIKYDRLWVGCSRAR